MSVARTCLHLNSKISWISIIATISITFLANLLETNSHNKRVRRQINGGYWGSSMPMMSSWGAMPSPMTWSQPSMYPSSFSQWSQPSMYPSFNQWSPMAMPWAQPSMGMGYVAPLTTTTWTQMQIQPPPVLYAQPPPVMPPLIFVPQPQHRTRYIQPIIRYPQTQPESVQVPAPEKPYHLGSTLASFFASGPPRVIARRRGRFYLD